MPAKVTRDQLIDDVQSLYRQLERAPLTTEYDRFGKYSTSAARKEFGSWRETLLACDIEPGKENRKLNSDADIIAELERLSNILGRNPTYTDIKKLSNISPSTFERRIGRTGIYEPLSILESLNPNWSVEAISESDGYWISGFVVGEGCFIVRKNGGIGFTICQRADDISNLEFVRDIMDLPKDVYVYSNQTRRNQGQKAGDECRLTINNKHICKARVVPFFDKFQLKGRKRMDYEIFKSAVLFLCNRDENGKFHQRFNETEKAFLLDVSSKLVQLRHDPTSEL